MKVKEFNKAFGLPIHEHPTSGDMEQARLRFNLMEEELMEYWEAVNIAMHVSEKKGIVAIADALTDLQYVLDGLFIYHGLADKKEQLLNEVHRSNMSKLGADGKPIYREDGKVMKGENYSKPDLKSIIDEALL